MAYGRTWHEGRAVRHHNLIAATQPPITGPIDKGKGRSNTAGKGKGKSKNPSAGGVSQLGALAYNSTGPTVGATTVIPMPSEQYDNSGYHSTVSNTSRLTVPSGGRLVRVASGALSTSAASVAIHLNGADFDGSAARTGYTTGTHSANLVSGIISASGGDYFEMQNATGTSEDFEAFGMYHSIEELDSGLQYALVKHSTTQSASVGNNTLAWDTEIADVGGWHDTVTNNSRLTVPSGVTLVRVSGGWYSATTTGTQIMSISAKNGVDSFIGSGHLDAEHGSVKRMGFVTAVLEVTAGDYFTHIANVSSAHTISAGGGTWFCIEEVDSSIKRALANRITSTFTLGASGDAVEWNSEVYDTDSIYDGANPTRMTAPAGVTQARLSFGAKGASGISDNLIGVVTRNGAAEQDGAADAGLPRAESAGFSNDFINAMGAWVPCSPGDYFELRLFSASAAIDADGRSWFCAEFK